MEPLSWRQIHDLEVREDYPAAIDALEARLADDASDREAVIRLGFNLWYAAVEDMRMGTNLPVQKYAARFVQLFRQYADRFSSDADFCWAFGLGMSLYSYNFPGTTEAEGNRLLDRACTLDPMWRLLLEQGAETSRLKGRGIFAAYYNVA